ncbi:MAG: tetratricopeptide repeat protein [Candidatus Eisenbacteria bacterium]
MNGTPTISVAALALMLATPALASFGSGPSTPAPTPSTSTNPTGDASKSGITSRQEAERWYHDAYEDIQKAKADLTARKDKSAEKRFRRALERGDKAVLLDATYHEAWNLVGYAARKLKDYDRAVAAYERCLKLKPDYAPAREYLGEAYVELGKIDLARQQLAALDPLKAPEEARTLQTAIEAWEKANPAAVNVESAGAK